MSYRITGPGDRVASPKVKGTVAAPLNPLGRPYAYCVILPDREDYLYADTFQDVLEYLLPGYGELQDTEEETVRRIRFAGEVASTMQATILASINPDLISDAEWDVLAAPKLGPQVATADWWRSPVPLVVVETSYHPYTSSSRPASATSEGRKADNIWWIRPVDPEQFLLSLHECGYLQILDNMDILTEEF